MTLVPRSLRAALPTTASLRPRPIWSPTVCSAPRVAVFGAGCAAGAAVAGVAVSTAASSVGPLLARAAQLFGADVVHRRIDRRRSVAMELRRAGVARRGRLRHAHSVDARSRLVATVAHRAVGQLRASRGDGSSRAAARRRADSAAPAGRSDRRRHRQAGRRRDASSAPAPWSACRRVPRWLAPRVLGGAARAPPRPVGRLPRPGESLGGRLPSMVPRCILVRRRAAAARPPPEPNGAPLVVADHLRSDGVNLVGYLTRESSLGDVARRLRDAIGQAGVRPQRDRDRSEPPAPITTPTTSATASSSPTRCASSPPISSRSCRATSPSCSRPRSE